MSVFTIFLFTYLKNTYCSPTYFVPGTGLGSEYTEHRYRGHNGISNKKDRSEYQMN